MVCLKTAETLYTRHTLQKIVVFLSICILKKNRHNNDTCSALGNCAKRKQRAMLKQGNHNIEENKNAKTYSCIQIITN
jgi:hypothetical protein